MAIGVNVPDENLVPGWNVQGGSNGNTSSGPGSAGYAQKGVTGDISVAIPGSATSNPGGGFPYPPGAMNVGSENSAAYSTPILENSSYSMQQNLASAGTNPTAVGAVITTTAALSAVVLSGLSIMLQTIPSEGTITYTVSGGSAITPTAGSIIPAGAAITTSEAGFVFVTAGM
jgi:hypothetical protein